MNRREFLRTLGAGAAAALGRAAAQAQAAAPGAVPAPAAPAPAPAASAVRKPNIIFMLADDLGYADVGCYGQQRIRTPSIDRLAAEGVRFTQAYSGATVCAPSRCSLMTGLHGGHAHIRGNREVQPEGQEPLSAESVTVARVLKDAGYKTACIGKWGLGMNGTTGDPNRHGFDLFFGYLCQRKAHSYYPEYLWRNGEKAPLDGKTYSHDLMAAEALRFVRENKDRPFLLYLAFTIPHGKYEAPDAGPYAAEPWPQVEKTYAAMITRMDADIGRLMALLRECGLDGDTLVFFASDNGPAKLDAFKSAGPLRGMKRDLYEGGIRVPMIARWPGRIKAAATSDQVWAFWDFPATAAEVAGAAWPAGGDGISMVPALLGRPQRGHEYLYWEFHERGFSQAVRAGNWKAVRNRPSQPIELYDLAADLGEKNNLADARPDVAAKMEELLKSARTDSPLFPIREPPAGKAAPARRKA